MRNGESWLNVATYWKEIGEIETSEQKYGKNSGKYKISGSDSWRTIMGKGHDVKYYSKDCKKIKKNNDM